MSDKNQKITPLRRRQPTTVGRQNPSQPVQSADKTKSKAVRVRNSSSAYGGQKSRENTTSTNTSQKPIRVRKVVKSPRDAIAKAIPVKQSGVASNTKPTATKQTVKPTAKPIATRQRKTTSSQINKVPAKAAKARTLQPQKRTSIARKKPPTAMKRTLLYSLRLLIVGVGIGAIVGTVLSVIDPASRINAGATASNVINRQGESQQQTQEQEATPPGLKLSQEISSLKNRVESLAAEYPSMKPGVLFADLENGSFVDVNANEVFSAASTIKFPILVAFFQDVDEGKIRLDENLTMQKEMMVGGSGDMREKPPGTRFKALEVADKMMTISDNTATNMMIARLGGIEAVNQRFRNWGLVNTQLSDWLPDLKGTNTTTPKELGDLFAMLTQNKLVSERSRERILDIMRRNTRQHLLPKGLPEKTNIAHKTGNIGSMVGDAGLITLPSGKRYVAVTLVRRPRLDTTAEKLIVSISRAGYREFNNPGSTPASIQRTPAPADNQEATPPLSDNPVSPTPSPTPSPSATLTPTSSQNSPTPSNHQTTPTTNTTPAPSTVQTTNTTPIPNTTQTAPLPNTNFRPIPNTTYTPQIVRPLAGTTGSSLPNTFQPPAINPYSPGVGSTVPVAPYQPPTVNPYLPAPYNTYQPPVVNTQPQYFPPR